MGDNKVRRERGNAEGENKEEIEIWTRVLFTYSRHLRPDAGEGGNKAFCPEPHPVHVHDCSEDPQEPGKLLIIQSLTCCSFLSTSAFRIWFDLFSSFLFGWMMIREGNNPSAANSRFCRAAVYLGSLGNISLYHFSMGQKDVVLVPRRGRAGDHLVNIFHLCKWAKCRIQHRIQ